MPTVPITDGARAESAKKLGLTNKLPSIDSIPVPASQASPGAKNVAPPVDVPSYSAPEPQPTSQNEYDQLLDSETRTPSGGNEYDAILNDERSSQRTALQGSMFVAAGAEPDRQAKVLALSKEMNLPPSMVERNYDSLNKKKKVTGTDYDDLIDNTPGLAKWMEDPNNAGVAHDDLSGLSAVEQTVQDHGVAYKALASFNSGATGLAAGIARIPNVVGALTYFPYNKYQESVGGEQVQYPVSNPVADWLDKQGASFSAQVPELSDGIVQEIGKGNYKRAGSAAAYQVISQVPQLAGMFASAGAGQAGKALAVMGGMEAAGKNKELAEAGVSPAQALPVAAASGAIEVGTEALGTFGFIERMGKALVKQAGKQGALEVFKSMGKVMLSGGATEATEESVGQFAKSMVDYSTGVNPNALKELPADVANAGILGFLTGGAAVGPGVTLQAAQKIAQNQQTTVTQEFYDAFGDKMREAKLRKRSPEVQRQFAESLVKNSPVQDVYINAEAFETYFQSQDDSPSNKLVELGVTQEAYDEAKETGAPLKINYAAWVEKTADTDAYNALKNDVKFDPGHLSVNEQKADQEQAKTELEVVDKQAKPLTEDEKISESGKAVRDDVAAQLKAINEDPAAAVLYRGFEVLGRRAGKDPLELYNRYGLKIGRGEMTEAGAVQEVLNQSRPKKKADAVKKALEESLGKDLGIDIYDSDYVREVEHGFDDRTFIKGARAKRAQSLGFDTSTSWFHGSRANIESFSGDTLGGSTGAGSARMAHFFASSPETASDYAQASNNALSLRSDRTEAEANRAKEEFTAKMREKYGSKWTSKLSPEEKSDRSKINKQFEQAAEDFERSQKAQKHKVEYQEYQIQQQENNVKFYESGIKTRDYSKRSKELKAAIAAEKSRVENTEWVKNGSAFNIINKATGEKLINSALADKEGDSKYRFYDPGPEYVRERIQKMEARLPELTKEHYLQGLQEARQTLSEMKAEHLKVLEGAEGQTVYKTVLKMQSPLIVDFKGAEYREVTYREILEKAQANGYDGVIFKNTYDPAFIGSMAKEPELMDVAAVFSPTQIRSVAAEFRDGESANILAQSGDTGPLAQIRFGSNRQFNIDLLKNANKSSFIHETGHFYVEVMGDLVKEITAIPESDRTEQQNKLVEDFTTLLEWAGAKPGEAIPVESHEKIARGFEAYLFEGKAPTAELRSAFARFRIWLVSIYKSIGNLRAELTPEVRDVMDRMLATDEEIQSVEFEQNQQPLFSDPKFQGMSLPKTKAYLKAIEEAREAATSELNSKLMVHHEKVRSEEWASEKEHVIFDEGGIDSQVNAMPIYRAIEQLQTGASELKLSNASVAEYGKDVAKGLPKNTVATKKSGAGLDVAIAAELLGFDSANDLITQLTNAEDKAKLIDRLAEEEMARRFPDMLKDGTLHEEAIAVAHNHSRAKVLRMELEHLASNNMPVLKEAIRRVARRVPTEAAVRQQAQAIIGKKSIKEISPYSYQRAEARSAKEAGVLLSKGDVDGAFQAKQRELLNHELFLAATAAREDYKKSFALFKKIAKADEKLAKSRDMDLVNAARAILSRFGIGKESKTPDSYLSQIKAYDPEAYQTVSALVNAATEFAGPVEEISFDTFLSLKDSIQAIWDLSKSNKEIEIEGKSVEIETAIVEINTRLVERAGDKEAPGLDRAITDKDKRSMAISGLTSMVRRVEHWAYSVDKGNVNGPLTKYIVRPVLQGTAKYRNALVDTMKELSSIVKEFGDIDSKTVIEAPELGYNFTKPELIMAVLHSGNDSNLRKLLVGRGWGSIDENRAFDRSAWDKFMQRAWNAGLITKSDMDAAQKIWDLNEKLKPAAQKAHKQMFGYYFSEITANEVVTPFGVYKGGYMPAIADYDLSIDTGIRASQNELEETPSQMFPTTGRGFTKGRVENYATPLSLDLTKIKNHMDKVLKFSYIEAPVKQAARMINNRTLRSELNNLDSSAANDLLIPWLKRAATQRSVTPGISKTMDKAFTSLRRTSSIQFMVLNVVNALQNNLAVFPAMTRVNAGNLAGSFKRYLFSPKSYAESVMETSEYMRSRIGDNAAEIRKEIDDQILNPSKMQELRDASIKHGYVLDRMTNSMMEVVIWGAAHEQELARGSSEQDAVNFADGTVRQVTAAANAEDISRFESGSPFVRLFTMFSTFFNTQANLLKTEFEIASEEGGAKGAARAARAYTLVVAAPAIASALIYGIMSGKGIDQDDDGEYFDDLIDLFFGSQFRYLMAFVPGGNIVSNITNRFNNKPYDDKISLSPAVSSIEKAFGAVVSVPKAAHGGGSVSNALKEGFTALGLATGLPIAPLAKPLGYAADVSAGKAKPSGPVDAARGAITGQSGKK